MVDVIIAAAIGAIVGLGIGWWLWWAPEPPVMPTLGWTVRGVTFSSVPKKEAIMAVDLQANQQVGFGVVIKDAAGQPAVVEAPLWEVSGPLNLSHENVTTPPYSCTVAATGVLGTGTLTFTCDADLGEGAKPLIGVASIVVAAGEAVVVELVPGTPTEITPESARTAKAKAKV